MLMAFSESTSLTPQPSLPPCRVLWLAPTEMTFLAVLGALTRLVPPELPAAKHMRMS